MRLIVTVVVCVLAPTVYTLLSLASVVPMTVPIFLGWLVWLQAVHVVAGVALWRRRATLSTRIKAALLSWGGLAVWYWLPAPVYFVLTMNLDELQVAWTALTFFWEVPVVGGAFVLAAQRLYPARAHRGQDRDPALRYREVMRYPTLVAGLLFVFTLAGYALGTLQLRIFAALPPIEQVKNLSHGIVISLLLAVFYYLALDRMLEPARTRIAREAGVGVMVVRTVAGRILGVTLAVAISGFALSSLFVLQAFQVMVRESATTTLTRDLAQLADSPDAGHQLGAVPRWGERGQMRLVHAGEELPAADFAPATLGDLNYHVLVAPSAEYAVTVYDAHAGEVALVLTDLVMPGMGGIGLLRALRERACRAPIVMMSGYVGEAASETITGVSAWVQKPVSARRLGQIIQEALTAPV